MENLKLTHEERRILKLNGILPQSIAKLVKSKVIRLAFKLGSRISMRESEKMLFHWNYSTKIRELRPGFI